MWAVLATEEAPEPGQQAIEWMLLTTVAAPAMEQAAERVNWLPADGALKCGTGCSNPAAGFRSLG
jgi:hypothetical protein